MLSETLGTLRLHRCWQLFCGGRRFRVYIDPSQSRYDSRALGTIKADQVYGFINAVIWPVNRINSL